MINKLAPNIHQLYFREFGSTVYVLNIDDKILLIDTSSEDCQQELLEDLEKLNIKQEQVDYVIITHDHWDHVGNNDLFTKAKILDYKSVDEIEKIFPEFKVIQTPGHKDDSICILYKDILFSGDTIFHHGGVGRTDLEGGNQEQLETSIKKLEKLDYKILAPGHI